MSETTKKNKDGNRIATIMAVVLSLALILAGTYAYTDFAQHSTNPFSGGEEVSVTLNDNYTPPVEWLSGQTVNKQVSVTNTDQSNRNVYVRLQLKEYMESYNLVPVQESGENVLFATYADGANKGEFMTWADAVAGGYEYTEYIVNGVSYARTSNDELRNGIYGKAMYIYSDLNIYGTADKADYIQEEQHTDECDYNVHMWDSTSLANRNDASDTIADYISWTLGTDVMLMSDWLTTGKPTGNFWILDEADGWIYWATAIAPGESTSNILESVKLDVMPGASFEYYIHIDMEAVTLEELTRTDGGEKWTDASNGAQELFDIWSTSLADTRLADTIKATPVGGTFIADEIEWLVLEIDETTGDRLIISNYVLNRLDVQWSATGTTNEGGYNASLLKTTLDAMYAGFTELPAYAKVPSYTNTEYSSSDRLTELTSCTTDYAGTRTDGIAIALSYADVSGTKYFVNQAARIGYDVTTKTSSWWTRTPISTNSNIFYVKINGDIDITYAQYYQGVRPALYVNVGN